MELLTSVGLTQFQSKTKASSNNYLDFYFSLDHTVKDYTFSLFHTFTYRETIDSSTKNVRENDRVTGLKVSKYFHSL